MRDHLNAVLADRYSVERELGRGGMASVWLARDLRHERLVAIKVLHPELAGAIGIDRFVREVRLTANLQHPGIIPVLDSGTLDAPDGTKLPWYSMAYVAGESLRQRLEREAQLPIDDALAIACEAAVALDAAHRQGIVHRDIKPENLLLAGGHVYVADFGIAKALMNTGGDRLTSTGIIIGTPSYMSPEQATSSMVDARTDQYSLATVIYEMLAGETPFGGSNPQSTISRRIVEPAPPIRSVRPSVSADLEATILRALERVAADRFPSVGDFAAALRNPLSASPSRANWRIGKPRVAAAAAIMFCLVSAAVWFLVGLRDKKPIIRDRNAIALYQRGVMSYDRRTPAGITDAVQAFSAAIRIDSTYSDAWSGLASTYVRAYERRFNLPGLTVDSMLRLAVAASDRALAGNRNSADVWVTQATVRRNVDPTDPVPAIRAARQALAIDSMHASAWHFLAISSAERGDFATAMSAWRRSVRADSAYLQGLAFLSTGHYWLGQYDSAEYWADSALAVDPGYLLGRTASGHAAIELGNYRRALAQFEAARRLSSGVEEVNSMIGIALTNARGGAMNESRTLLAKADSLAVSYDPAPLHTVVYMAQAHATLGQNDRAFEWIRRYSPLEDLHLQLHLRCDAALAPLAKDSRYRALIIRPAVSASQDCKAL